MKYLLVPIFLIQFFTSRAQNKQLIYNVDALPQTLMSNPGAFIDFDGHLGVPLLSQIHFSAGITGVNIDDIFSTSSGDINSRIRNSLQRLKFNDYFTFQEQLEIISLGWRLDEDHYFSAGIYQELDMFAYLPKDPLLLLVEGNRKYINRPFDLSHISFTGELVTTYHLGLNKRVNRRLTVGGRMKLYTGLFNVQSLNNTGIFITRRTPNGNNYYRHSVNNVNVNVQTSGLSSLPMETDGTREAVGKVVRNSLFGGNIGAGLDIGGSYVIREDWIVTGSFQDVGMIVQRKDVNRHKFSGSYETDGVEPVFPGEDFDGDNAIPYWELLEEEVEENLVAETSDENYISWRPYKINATLEYGFGEIFAPCDYRRPTNRRYENHVGLHLFGIKRPGGMKYALSAYFDKKITANFRMKVAYTVDRFSATNVGLMVSKRIKTFNVYLAGDNLFGYFNLAKTHSASIQMGLQFIFNRS